MMLPGFDLEMLPDTEIEAWLDSEKQRLGEWLKGFVVTWHRTETKHFLEIWSEAKEDFGMPNHPHGHALKVGETVDPDGLSVPLLQHHGRKLYFRLRKKYPNIRRDLGAS